MPTLRDDSNSMAKLQTKSENMAAYESYVVQVMLGQQSKVGGVESSDQNELAGIDSLCIFDMIPWLVCIRVPYKD